MIKYYIFRTYFNIVRGKNISVKDIPHFVSKCNVFVDSEGILLGKSKFDRWRQMANLPSQIGQWLEGEGGWCAHAGILRLLTFFASSRPLLYS